MKINIRTITNLKLKEAKKEVHKASEKSLKDVTVAITRDSIKGSPFLTGNNRRSIKFDIKGLTSSIFSTSGYGGYLETGTRHPKKPARPYFYPALKKHIGELPRGIKANLR